MQRFQLSDYIFHGEYGLNYYIVTTTWDGIKSMTFITTTNTRSLFEENIPELVDFTVEEQDAIVNHRKWVKTVRDKEYVPAEGIRR